MNELRMLLEAIEGDAALAAAERFRERIEALDRLDAYLPRIDRADTELTRRMQDACAQLEALNAALYRRIREDIRADHDGGRVLERFTDVDVLQAYGQDYDHLDELVAGVLQLPEPTPPTRELGAEMVFYQPTPARHVFAMIARSGLGEGDALVDLGAGLGHVPLLAAICTRARAVGIELEPAYVACATQAASALGLANAAFLQQDARDADFAIGTVFYLYTPFRGTILREVLDRLRHEAMCRDIRICTFGPCTPVVAQEDWLVADVAPQTDRVVVFRRQIAQS